MGGGKKMTRVILRIGRTTESGVGKRSQPGLCLWDEIDASTRGFCAILILITNSFYSPTKPKKYRKFLNTKYSAQSKILKICFEIVLITC